MTEKPNHWCKICGVGYYACNDCDKTGNWRAYACSVEHYQLYNVLAFYNKGVTTKTETVACLKSMDITKETAEKFIPGVRDKVIELLTEPVVVVVAEEPVVETEVKAPIVNSKKKSFHLKEKDAE